MVVPVANWIWCILHVKYEWTSGGKGEGVCFLFIFFIRMRLVRACFISNFVCAATISMTLSAVALIWLWLIGFSIVQFCSWFHLLSPPLSSLSVLTSLTSLLLNVLRKLFSDFAVAERTYCGQCLLLCSVSCTMVFFRQVSSHHSFVRGCTKKKRKSIFLEWVWGKYIFINDSLHECICEYSGNQSIDG